MLIRNLLAKYEESKKEFEIFLFSSSSIPKYLPNWVSKWIIRGDNRQIPREGNTTGWSDRTDGIDGTEGTDRKPFFNYIKQSNNNTFWYVPWAQKFLLYDKWTAPNQVWRHRDPKFLACGPGDKEVLGGAAEDVACCYNHYVWGLSLEGIITIITGAFSIKTENLFFFGDQPLIQNVFPGVSKPWKLDGTYKQQGGKIFTARK